MKKFLENKDDESAETIRARRNTLQQNSMSLFEKAYKAKVYYFSHIKKQNAWLASAYFLPDMDLIDKYINKKFSTQWNRQED